MSVDNLFNISEAGILYAYLLSFQLLSTICIISSFCLAEWQGQKSARIQKWITWEKKEKRIILIRGKRIFKS